RAHETSPLLWPASPCRQPTASASIRCGRSAAASWPALLGSLSTPYTIMLGISSCSVSESGCARRGDRVERCGMAELIVLSHYQAVPLLTARKAPKRHVSCSLDLGRTQSQATLAAGHVTFADGQQLPWEAVEQIAASENQCFVVSDGTLRAIQLFSETTNW